MFKLLVDIELTSWHLVVNIVCVVLNLIPLASLRTSN